MTAGGERGTLRYKDGKLAGRVQCIPGGRRQWRARPPTARSTLTIGAQTVTATRTREAANAVAAFFLAIAVVMLVARAFGWLAVRLGQPRVMGEVLAGIAARADAARRAAARTSRRRSSPATSSRSSGSRQPRADLLHVPGRARARPRASSRAGQPGGGDLEHRRARARWRSGCGGAADLRARRARTTPFVAFALFMGVSMSITAFPVLARILVERRMLKRPIGALALASAAIDDVSAWFLIALASAVAAAAARPAAWPRRSAWPSPSARDGVRRPAPARPCLDRLRRGRPRARRLDHGDLRGRARCRPTLTEEIGIARDLRRLRDGRGHAPPRGPDRGRHPPRGGLRRRPPAAAVLRLHRPAHERAACSTRAELWLLTLGAARRRDRRQVRRRRCSPRGSPAWAGASRPCSAR